LLRPHAPDDYRSDRAAKFDLARIRAAQTRRAAIENDNA
jgi:hypothetical protein